MSRQTTTIGLVLVLAMGVALPGFLSEASAQNNQTTVQLPTFSYFTTNTTVSVPDRGTAYLGGINRGSTGRQEFGSPLLPFKNRAYGTQRNVASQSVTVQVHNLEEMDEYLLNQPSRSALPRGPMVSGNASPNRFAPVAQAPPAAPTTPRWQASQGSAATPAMSVAQAKALHEKEVNSQMLVICRQGYQAEQAGRYDSARVCYQRALQQASGDLRQKIVARLQFISTKMAPGAIAQDTPHPVPLAP